MGATPLPSVIWILKRVYSPVYYYIFLWFSFYLFFSIFFLFFIVPGCSRDDSRTWLKDKALTELTQSSLAPSPVHCRSLPAGSGAPWAAHVSTHGPRIIHMLDFVIRNDFFHLSKNNPWGVMHISTTETRSWTASTSYARSALALSRILSSKLHVCPLAI